MSGLAAASRPFVAPALGLEIRRVAAEKVDVPRRQADPREEMPFHEGPEAPRVLRRQEQLVEVECLGAPEGGAAEPVEADELRVDGDHRLARRQDEAAPAPSAQDAGDLLRSAPRRGPRVREDLQPQAASSRNVISSMPSAARLSRIAGSQSAAISCSRSRA